MAVWLTPATCSLAHFLFSLSLRKNEQYRVYHEQHQLQRPSVNSLVGAATTTSLSSRSLEENGDGDTTDTGAATVTVQVGTTTYRGNDESTVHPTFRVEQGCGVYDHIRQDGQAGRVICCGHGDCLLGFLTKHQWLFSWL